MFYRSRYYYRLCRLTILTSSNYSPSTSTNTTPSSPYPLYPLYHPLHHPPNNPPLPLPPPPSPRPPHHTPSPPFTRSTNHPSPTGSPPFTTNSVQNPWYHLGFRTITWIYKGRAMWCWRILWGWLISMWGGIIETGIWWWCGGELSGINKGKPRKGKNKGNRGGRKKEKHRGCKEKGISNWSVRMLYCSGIC